MLNLHRNEYHFEHAPSVTKLLSGPIAHHSVSSYAEREVLTLFIESLAEKLEVSSQQITLYHGAEDALFKLLGWASSRAMRVYTTTWGWAEYMRMMQGFNLNVHQTPLKSSDDQFFHPTDEFAAELDKSSEPSLILLASPNNPTGHAIQTNEIVELAKRHPQHTFLLDSVYAHFSSKSFSQLAQISNVVNLGSFSKFFGLPGLRCGFAVGRVPDAHAMALGPSPFAVSICTAALNETDHYNHHWQSMQQTAKRLQSHATGKAGRFFKTAAPFVLFQCSNHISETQIDEAEKRVQVRGKVFTAQGSLYIRWSLTSPEAEQKIKECIQFLEDTL
jgi:histidinol-phosphate/aromatic aminotransferase/cobyric acid decarboxylase-like protein